MTIFMTFWITRRRYMPTVPLMKNNTPSPTSYDSYPNQYSSLPTKDVRLTNKSLSKGNNDYNFFFFLLIIFRYMMFVQKLRDNQASTCALRPPRKILIPAP